MAKTASTPTPIPAPIPPFAAADKPVDVELPRVGEAWAGCEVREVGESDIVEVVKLGVETVDVGPTLLVEEPLDKNKDKSED